MANAAAHKPTPHRPAVYPLWGPMAGVFFGAAVVLAGHYVSAWVLHLNACRAIAETLAASMERNEAARRAGRERRAGIDPLNPYTWTLDPPKDPAIDAAERKRMETASRQIAFVEIGAAVWKWSTFGLGGAAMILSAVGLARPCARRRLVAGVAMLGLIATVLAVTGMRLLVTHGGFQPQRLREYLLVLLAGAAVPAMLLGAYGRFARPGGADAFGPSGGGPAAP